MNITQGSRRPDGTAVHELEVGEYAFARTDPDASTALWIRVPSGELGHIAPTIWTIRVEADDTVTVDPSIWSNKNADPPGWHGYLQAGVWRQV